MAVITNSNPITQWRYRRQGVLVLLSILMESIGDRAPMATNWESAVQERFKYLIYRRDNFNGNQLKPDGKYGSEATKNLVYPFAVNGKAVLVGTPWYNERD